MEFKTRRIVVATHYLVYGCAQALRDYLMEQNIGELLFVAHPLNADAKGDSYFEIISGKDVLKKEIIARRTNFGPPDYAKEVWWNLWAVFKQKKTYHLFVAADNLNAFAGVLLRKLGKVKKVVYWTLDYGPVRFKNPAMNTIFHWLDRFCVGLADETWNVSPRMAEGREHLRGMDRKKFNRQKVVPAGIWYDKIKRPPFKNLPKRQLLFIGDLGRKANFEEILGAVPLISRKINGFHFLIVGGGDREKDFQQIAKQLDVESCVTFTGWVRDRKKLDELIYGSTVGLALYEKYDENGNLTFANFSDPGKIKDYLSAGLPVLVSEVPYNAQIIEERKCGKIVKPDKNEIAEAVIEIMEDEKTLLAYRKNALEYIHGYNWNVIFSKNLTKENLFS